MTNEDQQAVEITKRDAQNYPHNVRHVFDHGTRQGHALVSQGAGVFRCVKCDERNELRSPAFPNRCTATNPRRT